MMQNKQQLPMLLRHLHLSITSLKSKYAGSAGCIAKIVCFCCLELCFFGL